MARIAHKRRPTTRTRAPYLRHALKHPTQALVLVVPAMLALLTLSIVVPLVVLLVSEVLVLGVLPRSERFRRAVDDQLERVARTEAAAQLGPMLAHISEEHRIELERLQQLAAQIRERSNPDPKAGDWLGLSRLLAAYIRLAMAHRASAEAFRAHERVGLFEHISRLEAMSSNATGATRPWIDRRLAIARRRLCTWRRGDEDRERMMHGLATIGEILRWMAEECATSRAESVHAELEDALSSWEQNGATLHELSQLCDGIVPVDVDVDVLALCRARPPGHVVPTRVALESFAGVPREVEVAVREEAPFVQMHASCPP